MIIKQFVGLDKNKAARRALDYWYKNFLDVLTLKDFISKCSWRQGEGEVIVTYRGPEPPIKK